MITHSCKRIRSKRSEIHTDNSLYFCDVHKFYYKFENDFIDVKYFCRYYDIYHNWKVPGENFLLLTYRTCRVKVFILNTHFQIRFDILSLSIYSLHYYSIYSKIFFTIFHTKMLVIVRKLHTSCTNQMVY